MALNVKLQIYRGLKANLPAVTTGSAGVLAWTTDSNELFVDDGSTGFLPIANDIAVFTAADQSAMVALAAKVGDLCKRSDTNLTYILTAFPASTAGNWVEIASNGTAIQGLASGVAHEWVSYVDTNGVQHLTQPSFADISGQLAQTQLPTTIGAGASLTSVDLGTF
jgi:hypothetical protein